MIGPSAKVEIAFDTDPLDTPIWTDVTSRLRGMKITRGKARVLSRQRPSTISLVLDNRDGSLTPENTASPYYPNVLPMRRVQVSSAVVDAYGGAYGEYGYGDIATAPVCSGFIDAWPQTYPGMVDAEVPVHAVDALAFLNLMRATDTRPQELSSARVGAVLDAVGWPADLRAIGTGQTTVQAVTLDGDNPVEHLQKVADSENGLLFVGPDSSVRFIGRHDLLEKTVDTELSGGSIGFRDIVIVYDDVDLWNRIEVSSQGVATQVAEDTDSQTKYGFGPGFGRVLERTGLLLTSEDEQLSHAQYLLVGYREPALRVEKVTVGPGLTDVQWEEVLGKDLGDKVLVVKSPEGDVISQRSYIEGISIGWMTRKGWTVTWNLVPATRRTDFWLAGDEIQSLAGETTRGGY